MVTIFDVARHAGVSKSTVSLVLNKSPLVKDETRLKVEEAIRALGYVPNQNARGLIKKETKCLGVIIAIEDQPRHSYEYTYETGLYSYNITNGIPVGLQDTDYGLLTERFCAPRDGQGIPKLIRNNRVDGIFLVGGLFGEDLIEEICARNLPVVAVGRRYDKIDSVSVDVSKAVYLAVKHLLETGHQNICYINCPEIYRSSKERADGVAQAMSAHNKKMQDDWMVYCRYNTGEGGYLAFKALWESGARPDAIAAANEPIALGIMRYLYEQNIRVPDDISLVAYDTSVLGGYAAPPITSVNISKEKMGEIAAQMLLRRIDAPGKEIESIIIDPELVIQSSVKKRN